MIPRWLLRSIFTLFPEQLVNCFVSWGSPYKFSMIDYFLLDAFTVLSCLFLEYSSALWCSAADTHLKLRDRVISADSFLTGGVFEYNLAHRRSLAVSSMLYKIRCYPMHPLYGVYVYRMCRCGLHVVLWLHIGTLMPLFAAEPRSSTWLLLNFWYLCGTALVTPYSMVWDWRISRAGPMSFYYPSCSVPFCHLMFSISFILFYCLVLWGKGFRTDRVLITLSQPRVLMALSQPFKFLWGF